MAIPVACDHCGKSLRVGDELAGKRVKCRCGATLDVPEADDEIEPDSYEHAPRSLPRRKRPATSSRRRRPGPSIRVSFNPDLLKRVVRGGVWLIVVAVVLFLAKTALTMVDMATSMPKINALRKQAGPAYSDALGTIRKNQNEMISLLQNPQADPSTELFQPYLAQIAAAREKFLQQLAAIQVPDGLDGANEFLAALREGMNSVADNATAGMPPMIAIRQDASRPVPHRRADIRLKCHELKTREQELVVAMLNRALHAFGPNKPGIAPDEVRELRSLEASLQSAKSQQESLQTSLKNAPDEDPEPASRPAPAVAARPADDERPNPPPQRQAPPPRQEPTTPVPTEPVSSLASLKRGMKVWVKTGLWESGKIVGKFPAGQVVLIMSSGGFSGMGLPADLDMIRVEPAELVREDLKNTPALAADPPMTPQEFTDMQKKLFDAKRMQ